MDKILLDTNIIMACKQFKVDIFSEFDRICNFKFKIFVLDKSMTELEKIINTQKGGQREAAKFGLELLRHKNVEIITTSKKQYADDDLVDYSQKGYIIATQDKDLKRRLINQNARLITLRQKKILAFSDNRGLD
jgi:rRNA-processing protein FCF1